MQRMPDLRPHPRSATVPLMARQDIPLSGSGSPWFKFWAVRWFNSETITKMSCSERGFFIQLIAACWIFGEVTRDPWRLSQLLHVRYETTTKWLHKWSHLVVDGESGCSYLVVPKLDELQVLMRKSGADMVGEERREEENRPEETITASPSNLVEPQGGQSESKPAPPASQRLVMSPSADYFKNPDGSRPLEGFDPFAIEPFDGWTAEQIKTVADFHWTTSKLSWWRDNCQTEEFFKRNFEKMSKAVPQRSKPKTRTQEKFKQVEV